MTVDTDTKAVEAELLKCLDDGRRDLDELLRQIANIPQPLIPGEQTYDRLQRISRRSEHMRHARHYIELGFLMAKEALDG